MQRKGFFWGPSVTMKTTYIKVDLGIGKRKKNKENHVKCNYFDAFQFGMQTRASTLNTDSKLHGFCKYHIGVPGKFLGIHSRSRS